MEVVSCNPESWEDRVKSCECEVRGINGRWYIDIFGNYICGNCRRILSQTDKDNLEEIDWEQTAWLYFRIAEWFATHEKGIPVPEWCNLSQPFRMDEIRDCCETFEEEMGYSVDGSKRKECND